LLLTLASFVILSPRILRAKDLNFTFLHQLYGASARFFQNPTAASELTVHEWGTFTSIVGPDGLAMEWRPLSGPPDLPAFVEHLETAKFKGGLRGTIRMETPVLYFYAPEQTTVSVHVSFSKGLITEWYPHASVPTLHPQRVWSLDQKQTEGTITWKSEIIDPAGTHDVPPTSSTDRYDAARHTSSTPLTVNATGAPQHEKFPFYRGVSAIQPALTAALPPDGTVLLQHHFTGEFPTPSSSSAALPKSASASSAP
jgi:hypothetical protein